MQQQRKHACPGYLTQGHLSIERNVQCLPGAPGGKGGGGPAPGGGGGGAGAAIPGAGGGGGGGDVAVEPAKMQIMQQIKSRPCDN